MVSDMRLGWLTVVAVPSFAFVCLACTGQKLEGAWYGPLPAIEDGGSCRIRLYGNRTFDYTCRDPADPKRDKALGAGKYSVSGERISFDRRVSASPTGVKRSDPAQFSATFRSGGNQIWIRFGGMEEVEWVRGQPKSILRAAP